VGLACFIEFRRVELLKVFFLFQVLVKIGQFRPQRQDVLHFAHQDAVEFIDILLDVALGLLDVLKDAHIRLDDIYHVVDVLSVLAYQLFFLLQDDLDKVFVVTTDLVNIVGVFDLAALISL